MLRLPIKRSATVHINWARSTPSDCDRGQRDRAVIGIWMKCICPNCGKRQYLWRAVNQNGEVFDILVQARRNKQVAKGFFRTWGTRSAEVLLIYPENQ